MILEHWQLPLAEQRSEIYSRTTSLHHKVQGTSHEMNNAKWSGQLLQSTCKQVQLSITAKITAGHQSISSPTTATVSEWFTLNSSCVTQNIKLPRPTNTHTHFPRTTWESRYQKGKTSLDLNEARDDGDLRCSGISWTIRKQSAPRSRQITTLTPHHSNFYMPDALPGAQPTLSNSGNIVNEWRWL